MSMYSILKAIRSAMYSKIVMVMTVSVCLGGFFVASAIGSQESSGNTPLMEAALHGDLAAVSHLLEAHANINEINSYGLNALYFAAGATPVQAIEKGVAGSTDVLQLLLQHGADVRAKSKRNGMNALMAAADNKRSDRVSLLLEHAADPNATTTDGNTPLMFAIRRRDVESVNLLLKAGARVNNVADSNGDSPILIAVQANDLNMVQMILQHHPDVNRVNRNGESPLVDAVMNGNNDVAVLLLEAGANPDIVTLNLNAMTPLMLAASNGNEKLVDELLSKHAKTDLKDNAGRTAAVYARWYGYHALALKIMGVSQKN